MKKSKPPAQDIKRHSSVQRDAMEEHTEIKYVDPNRDRALGNADRTGRHFDELPEDSDEVQAD